MTKTRQAKLADCVELLSGFAFKSQQFTDDPDDVALVKGENVSQGRVLWDISKRWPLADWDKFEKFQLTVGDVVIAMDRPWVPAGLKWCFIRDHDTKALLVQRCCRLRANPSLMDQTFLRCVVGGPGFESYIKPITTGVNIPHISGKQILDYTFNLPELPTQRKIAGILSAYDDLIENNLRRIKILEQMAQSLYREWFVHFRFPGHESATFKDSVLGRIPEGWEVKRLDEIGENFDRQRKPISKAKRAERQGIYPYYGAAKIFDYLDDYLFDGEYLLMAEDGSVITPDQKPVLQLATGKFWVNNHTHILRGSLVSTHFLYLALSEVNISGYITGAAQPKITQGNMNRLPFVCGSVALHTRFDRLVQPLVQMWQSLDLRNQNLRHTRDLLLPKLLSGGQNLSGILQ